MKALSLALLVVVLSAVVVSAADKPVTPGGAKTAPTTGQAAAPSADQQAMMQKWMQIASPSEAHKKLEASVGTWDTTVQMWMSPDAPAQETTGVSKNTMVLGGRWLEQSFEGTMMGQPFHGIGYTGYDNYKKQYVGLWMDTQSTSAMMSTGTCDASGKTMTFTGTLDNCMTGTTDQFKEVLTIVDADHQNFEMWATGPDGKMYKNMEIHYTRKA
jgi:hypothetical protein